MSLETWKALSAISGEGEEGEEAKILWNEKNINEERQHIENNI